MTPRQQSILIGTIVTAILSTSYLGFINILCCLGVMIGGAVTTQQYVSRTHSAVEAGDGAVLGALAGAAGSILTGIFDWVLRPLNLDRQSIMEPLQQQMMQNAQPGQGPSPDLMQQFQGDGGGMFSMLGILGLLVNLIIFAIFGALGGAIGAAMFGKEEEA